MNLQSLKFGYERQQKKINRRGIIDTHTIKPLEDQNISFQDSTTHTLCGKLAFALAGGHRIRIAKPKLFDE